MPYLLSHPDPTDKGLRAFSSLNSHLEPEGVFQKLRAELQEGRTSRHDLWLLTNETGNTFAALRLRPYPMQPAWRLGTLRTTPDIPDEAVSALLQQVLELSRQGGSIHLVYSTKTARDFGALPARCGWQGGGDASIAYRTDLSERDDLMPDPAASVLEFGHLFSDAFRTFYEPIRQVGKTSDARPFEVVVDNLFELASRDDGQLYALEDEGKPVAMGIVTSFTVPGEKAAGCNVLGVALNRRRRGWGRRLHRHLMWAAKGRSPLYLGHTDASNTAMRRLFEVNGCVEESKSWELEPEAIEIQKR